MNRNLFSALRLEKLVMGIILSIIVIVAAGLIVATVIMLVLEKRKEISVLKALGVPDGGIVKIFLAEGLQIGVAGGLLGLFSGLAWCLFIEKVGIKLDPEVYYIPSLPVKIEPLQTALAGGHRGPRHLPRVHLPGAQGSQRGAGGRAEGGVADGASSRSATSSRATSCTASASTCCAGVSLDIETRRAGLRWWAPPGAGKSTFLHVLGTLDAPGRRRAALRRACRLRA